MRTPIGVTRRGQDGIVVVCDDGAVFFLDDKWSGWTELPTVPGSQRDEIRKRSQEET